MVIKIIKITIVFLLSLFFIFDTIDILQSIIKNNPYLYVLVIGTLFRFPLLSILTFFSLILKKSEVRWQKIIGVTGLLIVILDVLVNLGALILGLIK